MIPFSLQTFDHYGYAAVAVLGTLAAVVAIDWLMRGSPLAAWVRSLHGVVPPFINIIGVLFGLTLAFLANDTWSAHDRTTNAVYKEADALRSLAALSTGLPEQTRNALRAALTEYRAASVEEWAFLARRTPSARTGAGADRLLTLIMARETREAAGDTVQALMLRNVTDIRVERDVRISLSQTHVNPLKWLGMAFLGFVTLLSVAVVHAENARAALVAMVLFACAAAPTAAIVLVQSNPFQPPSAVSFEPLTDALPGW
jgi:hypothetical protein